jgi:hypothetical protein
MTNNVYTITARFHDGVFLIIRYSRASRNITPYTP